MPNGASLVVEEKDDELMWGRGRHTGTAATEILDTLFEPQKSHKKKIKLGQDRHQLRFYWRGLKENEGLDFVTLGDSKRFSWTLFF